MKKALIPALGAIALGIAATLYVTSTSHGRPRPTAEIPTGAALVSVTLPSQLSPAAQIGKKGFDAVCAQCHGENAAGRQDMGPPLIHRIYEPSHHGDMSFLVAAAQGVRAHHWSFGDMPPQAGLTQGDVKAIVTYVRELQRANGIE